MPENIVKFSTIDLSAEIKKYWGSDWNKGEVSYEFSSDSQNKRRFELRTGDSSIYSSSPDFS